MAKAKIKAPKISGDCNATADGMKCTRPLGHRGHHKFRDAAGSKIESVTIKKPTTKRKSPIATDHVDEMIAELARHIAFELWDVAHTLVRETLTKRLDEIARPSRT